MPIGSRYGDSVWVADKIHTGSARSARARSAAVTTKAQAPSFSRHRSNSRSGSLIIRAPR